MGMGGISIWQLLIILVIVVLLFGTKRLKNIGSDLGNAVKGFRSAMSEPEQDDTPEDNKRLGDADKDGAPNSSQAQAGEKINR